jgi:putative FmdB family regulatory protein
MPLYEYQCDACGHRFETIQKFSDPPIATCPKCGGAVHKLQSAPAFQFKGSGWYITDYAKKDAPATKSGDAAPSDQAAKTDGTKTSGGEAATGGEKPSSTPAQTTPSSGTSSQKHD